MKFLFLLFLLVFISSCSSLGSKKSDSDTDAQGQIIDLENILNRAEENATPEGKSILTTGRSLIEKKKIIKGSCWDYANAVFNKAGYAADQRITPLKSKFKGPYADLSTIQAGDWLYFINYSFKESDHSGIFVEWTDFDNKKGVILSYVGGKKKKPGNYKIYDLRHVYYIIRPK